MAAKMAAKMTAKMAAKMEVARGRWREEGDGAAVNMEVVTRHYGLYARE